MNLSKDHLELLSVLNAHNVRYLVIGGYAVGFHSEPRATKDIDVFIRSDPQNSQAVFRALAEFGAPLAGLTSEDFSDGKSYYQMGHPPHRADVLQSITGVDFDECWEDRTYATVGPGLDVPVISAEKLIKNKLATGRLRDTLDVEAIREAQAAVARIADKKP